MLDVTPLQSAGFCNYGAGSLQTISSKQGIPSVKIHTSSAAVYAILELFDPFVPFFNLKLLLIRSAAKVRALRQTRGECEV